VIILLLRLNLNTNNKQQGPDLKISTIAILLLGFLCPFIPVLAQQQTKTAEDSLSDTLSMQNSTSIGGYGDAFYQRDFNSKTSVIDLERVVLFVGHNFGSISFFSELEMENAKVSGGEDGGEIAFEQAYLKFNIDQSHYFTAGLFLPRIGILNEDHLPNSFNGTERTQVETFILPSTWRELGIGFYGDAGNLPVNYSIAVVNGLNSAAFRHGSGIREGRFEGRSASANNLAVTGALQFYLNSLRVQVSGYYGGSVGLSPRQADSLHLASGIFGTPVIIGEGDVRYKSGGLSFRALGTIISIPDASDINRAYANNTPKTEYGAYAEIGYDVLHCIDVPTEKQLIVFLRYENLDMNAVVPANGIIDGTLDQQHVITGLNYLPVKNIVIKADVRFVHTGDRNPALTINANPFELPYQKNNTLVNLGLGFSF
jgi:hypothetical protein